MGFKRKNRKLITKAIVVPTADLSRPITLHVMGFGEIHPALRKPRHYRSLDNALKRIAYLAHTYLKPRQTIEIYHAVTCKQLAWHRVKVSGYAESWTIMDEEWKGV